MTVRSPHQCRRCNSPIETAGTRGLCLSCLNVTTTYRFSAAKAMEAVDDLKLEEGLAVGPQDRFLLHDRLGVGGMGEVWLATDQELSREGDPHWVALKFLGQQIRSNRQAIDAVRSEVIRSQELNHKNIVRVFDLHTTMKGMPFIKMEYVKGNSLVYWLEDTPNRVMHWKEVTEIAQQLCSALQYAHESASVIHRDIKPGNLLLRKDRILKVADFGIAEALYTTHNTPAKQRAIGTIWYASPQQLLGQRASPADDIHAVGATLYELLSGEPPYLGDTTDHTGADIAEALVHQVRHDPAEPIEQRVARRGIHNDVPEKLASLIHRCLEKDALARPLAREILTLLPTPGAINPTQGAPRPAGSPTVTGPATPYGRPTPGPKTPGPRTPAPATPAPERWEAPVRDQERKTAPKPIAAELWEEPALEEPKPKSNIGTKLVVTMVTALILAVSALVGVIVYKEHYGGIPKEVEQQTDLDKWLLKLKLGHVRPGTGTGPTTPVEAAITNGTLVFDVSKLSRSSFPLSVTISPVGGFGATNLSITSTLNNPVITQTTGSYLVKITYPDSSTKEANAEVTVGAPFTVLIPQPVAPGSQGSMRIYFQELLVTRPGKRTLTVTRLDANGKEAEEVKRAMIQTTVRSYPSFSLDPGPYVVAITESLGSNGEEWVFSTNTTVAQGSLRDIVLAPTYVTVDLECNLNNPTVKISWPPQLSPDAKPPSFPGASVRLPLGKFPIYASAEKYEMEPASQMARIEPNYKKARVILREKLLAVDGVSFVNSIGLPMDAMTDIRLGREYRGIWASRYETRVADFQKFVKETGHQIPDGLFTVTGTNGVTELKEHRWNRLPKAFGQSNTNLPVVGVNWEDAMAFCRWLTESERLAKRIGTNRSYTLPSAQQWFELAGKKMYPWGDEFSDVKELRAGNYSRKELMGSPDWPSSWPVLDQSDDKYLRLAPPIQDFANTFGLIHMGGNAAEWTSDKTAIGGSWMDGEQSELNCLKTRSTVENVSPEQRHDRIGFRVILVTDYGQKQ